MRLLGPIKQEQCSRLIGLPVCAILQDGSRHIGVLSRAQNGKLYLNDDAATADISANRDNAKSAVDRKAKISNKATSSNDNSTIIGNSHPFDDAFPDFAPYGYPGNSNTSRKEVFDLASVSVLFPLI